MATRPFYLLIWRRDAGGGWLLGGLLFRPPALVHLPLATHGLPVVCILSPICGLAATHIFHLGGRFLGWNGWGNWTLGCPLVI
jgi:hypothetical protein